MDPSLRWGDGIAVGGWGAFCHWSRPWPTSSCQRRRASTDPFSCRSAKGKHRPPAKACPA